MKKAAPINIAIFTGKHLCWNLYLLPGGLHYYKKETQTQVFSCKNTYFEHLRTAASDHLFKGCYELQNDIVVIALLRTLEKCL